MFEAEMTAPGTAVEHLIIFSATCIAICQLALHPAQTMTVAHYNITSLGPVVNEISVKPS